MSAPPPRCYIPPPAIITLRYHHATLSSRYTIITLRCHHATLSLRCVVITLHYRCAVGFNNKADMPVHGVVSGLDGPALWEAASNNEYILI